MRRSAIASLLLSLGLTAQTKLPPSPADYGQWETLVNPGRYGGLSPDGKWLASGINRANGNNELRIVKVADGSSKTIPFGAQPVFAAGSQWVACSIGYSETQQDKLRKDKKPVQNKLGLMNLATGDLTVVDDIQTFAFSPGGDWLAMRRYAPEKPPPATSPDAAALTEDEAPAGATLILRHLTDGRDISFGNVSEYAWQDRQAGGHLLAMVISGGDKPGEDKTGNAVQLFDTASASLRVLDSAATTYSGLAWRKDSADLAFLRWKTDDKHESPTCLALAWTHLGDVSLEADHRYDPATDASLPAGMRTVSYRKPSWSFEGDIVFIGLSKWEEKLPVPKDAPAKDAAAKDASAKEIEEPATVDVWHWRDAEVMPRQKIGVRADRQKYLLAAWHIGPGTLVPLGHELTEQVVPLKHRKLAVVTDWKAYAMERSIGRPAADLYLADLATGSRTKLKERLADDRYVQSSPGGRYLIYLQDDQYWTIDVATGATVGITNAVTSSFIDRESDDTVKQKPPFGIAGWTKDDASVILYDKFDLWQVTPDGSAAVKLTDGAAEQIRHRYVRLDPDEEFIDTDKPLYLSLFGIWSKKSGYSRLNAGKTPHEEHLLWADKAIDRLGKAQGAETFSYNSESFEESPNTFVGGPGLQDVKPVTRTNAFQSNYAWGHSELVDYKNSRGERLQGALYYPAGYEAGRKYPMIVYLYEKLSDGLHRYRALSERDYYNASAVTSHGYLLLMPDIVFRPREPGLSVVDCVTAAVKKVSAMGVVDDKKIGVMGHSWGGFDTTYLATHSTLFAAAVAGAPITDLVSNYGNHHWSSGIAETDHIETGQQRMEVPLWEDLQAYIRNSAVFNAQNMTTPLLIEVGDSDGTVFFHQGVELYNVARRAKKNVVLLVYAGEDHGLRKKPDQIDYQRRLFAWFGHYLKGEQAPGWITEGQSYLDRQQEVKKLKAPQVKAP